MKVRRVHSELRETVASYDARRTPLKSPESVAATLSELLENEPQEVFGALLLDAKHMPIGWHEVSRGSLTASIVHPREVFGAAIRMGAAALIVAHNHPSGDPKPSREDLQVTKRLVEGGTLLGINVLDHVIVGADGAFSSARADGWGAF